MKNLTRNGIAKNLGKSPYCFTELVNEGVVTFHFSSRLHLNNFCERRDKNYTMIYNYLYKRFKYKVDCRMLADCNLYTKIETRGFYIKFNNKEYVCPDNLILNGDSKMKKSYGEWQEILTTSSEDS